MSILKNTKILNPFSSVNEKGFQFPLAEVCDIFANTKNKSFVNCIKFKVLIWSNTKILDKNNIVDFFNFHFDRIKKELEDENDYEIPQITFINPIDVMLFLFYFVENKNKLSDEKYHQEVDAYLKNIDNNLGLKWRHVGHQISMYYNITKV